MAVKGLELGRCFFAEVVLTAVEQDLPACVPHLAAGMCGGSQSYGNDDGISRDHGWGAGISVWLWGDASAQFRKPLAAVATSLPREFLGYPAYCAVMDLDEFMTARLGFPAAPKQALDWLRIPEKHLFEVAYAPVFCDGPGEVTRRFQALARYPEDVWRQRLATHLSGVFEWGIKHLRRAERRGDSATATLHWCQFAVHAMHVGFLLCRRYAPYHKWLCREFGKLPQPAARMAPLLAEGFARTGDRIGLTDDLIAVCTGALKDLGYIPAPLTSQQRERLAYPEAEELLPYVSAVRAGIADNAIRELGADVELLDPVRKESPLAEMSLG
jgi:hypothetical protein